MGTKGTSSRIPNCNNFSLEFPITTKANDFIYLKGISNSIISISRVLAIPISII